MEEIDYLFYNIRLQLLIISIGNLEVTFGN
jgi:hypothetical protein